MPRYGLIGEKLGHSFSKPIHEALGGYAYELIPLAPEELEAFIRGRDYAGLNVTIPYKQAVMPLLDEVDNHAREIGAVNTIVNRDGRLIGYNTDYVGFRETLRHREISAAGKTVLVLGNGGACKPVCAVLRDLGAAGVLVASRQPVGTAISYEEALSREDISLLVNATPVGMFPNLDNCPISLDVFPRLEAAVDLIYNPLRTELLMQAQHERGIPAVNGLYMLVWQAKAAAELFLGKPISPSAADGVYTGLYADKCNLVLTGMPMSGKSTVGRLVADTLGRRFVDADEEIVRRAGMPIPEIFERFSQAGFRKLEQEVLRDLSLESGLVLATGGGAPLFPENVRNLRRNGLIFFLDRPLDCLRVGKGRPLAKSPEEIAALFEQRAPIYSSTCDSRILNAADADTATENLLREFRRMTAL